jgi:hypothetical protein
MPLPQLDTSGIGSDLPNVLARIQAMKTGQLQQQNLQSEIESRPALNTFRQAETSRLIAQEAREKEKADAELRKANLEDVSQSLRWLQGVPEEQKVDKYKTWYGIQTSNFKSSGGKKGVHPQMVLDPTTVTPEQIDKFAEMGLYATKQLAAGKPGEKFSLIKQVDNFDPSNPQYEKIESVLDVNNKPVVINQAPAIEFMQKEKELKLKHEETQARIKETEARDRETKEFHRGIIGVQGGRLGIEREKLESDKVLVPVKQEDGTVVYTKRSDAVGKEVGARPKPSSGRFSGARGASVSKLSPEEIARHRTLVTGYLKNASPTVAIKLKAKFKEQVGEDFDAKK